MRLGYIPNLPETRITEFEQHPVGLIDKIVEAVKAHKITVNVKKHAEDALAKEILCRIG